MLHAHREHKPEVLIYKYRVMAERGAHITATSQSKPSIFEVVAQDSLTSSINPALKRIAEFVASYDPVRYGWLVKWFDEAYLALNIVVQYHYLSSHGSSLAENFYGLRRVSLRNPTTNKLTLHEVRLSLLCLTVLPYLRSKFEQLATQFRLEEADGVSNKLWSESSRQVIMKAHAMLHMTWEGAVLAQYLSYLSGNSASHSPLLRLAGVTLEYNTDPEDFTWGDVWGQFMKGDVSLMELSAKVAGSFITRSLEFGAFFVQFLQWWYREQPATSLTALPVPIPREEPAEIGQEFSGICPICLENRKIETILPVSGYVFCYRCIVRHLKVKKYCPVTKYPATADDLIRIYSSES